MSKRRKEQPAPLTNPAPGANGGAGFDLFRPVSGTSFWEWDVHSGETVIALRILELFETPANGVRPAPPGLKDIIHPDDYPDFLARMNEHLEGLTPVLVSDFRVRDRSGEWRWVQNRGRVMSRDAGGWPLRMVGMATDITDLRGEQERARFIEERLLQAQKLEAIGTLASGIAHDFNNVLSVILGFTELAVEHPGLDAEVLRNLNHVLKAGKRARDLVNRILAFGHRGEPEFIPIRLQEVIDEAYLFLRPTIPASIDIRLDVDPACPQILGDLTQVQQVLVNLMTNAYHAMMELDKPETADSHRMTVSLAVTDVRENVPGVFELPPGRCATLSVADTGMGMPAEVIERIFEPYFTTKEVGFGHGLGLPVVYGIVKAHHGAIVVRSEPGKGSTFQIHFPLCLSGGIPDDAPLPDDLAALRGRERVLVADDERFVARLYRQILTGYGYRVTTCGSGHEALDRFEQNPGGIDALVIDLTMPKLSGFELARKVRKVRPDVPIVICTGFSVPSILPEARKMGIEHVIQKPFPMVTLAKVLRAALDRPPRQ
ncbi:MAG: response regulator [Acidobacteria bacterium]|nr:response regulator [Acidobacteriota bacterium]